MISTKESKPISLLADIPDTAQHWRNMPSIRKWCRQYSLLTEANQAEWMHKIHTDPTIKMFGIALMAEDDINYEGEYCGVCGFTSIDKTNRSAEFSLYIVPYFHKKGYGKKALNLLLQHGFFDWGFNRIWGEVFDGNPAMNSFERLGFKKEGTLRSSYFRNGKWIDSHMVSMLASDYAMREARKPKLEVIPKDD